MARLYPSFMVFDFRINDKERLPRNNKKGDGQFRNGTQSKITIWQTQHSKSPKTKATKGTQLARFLLSSPPGPPENCYQNFELIAIAFPPPPPLAILLSPVCSLLHSEENTTRGILHTYTHPCRAVVEKQTSVQFREGPAWFGVAGRPDGPTFQLFCITHGWRLRRCPRRDPFVRVPRVAAAACLCACQERVEGSFPLCGEIDEGKNTPGTQRERARAESQDPFQMHSSLSGKGLQGFVCVELCS